MNNMQIVFLGLNFNSGNKGCEALSYSFSSELSDIANELGIKIEVTAMVFGDLCFDTIPGTNIKISYLRIRPKKRSFWREYKKILNESDIVFDFTAGDSFTDMYGMKRFIVTTLLKQRAVNSKARFVLGPQTYGPFKRAITRMWAKKIILKSSDVFSRDDLSANMVKKISGRTATVVTDVAFSLPYNKIDIHKKSEITYIGFNPSGLLYYSGEKFGLKIDYQEYVKQIMDFFSDESKYIVYLIPHVWSNNFEAADNDLGVCKVICEHYKNAILANSFSTPMEAKSLIAEMDLFIGARMHATIAAFSSGVATIPVSYSYKFEGLYHSIGYPYVIEAKNMMLKEAVEKTVSWVKKREILEENNKISMNKINKKQQLFRNEISRIFSEVMEENKKNM